jgi:hypothetical protein
MDTIASALNLKATVTRLCALVNSVVIPKVMLHNTRHIPKVVLHAAVAINS